MRPRIAVKIAGEVAAGMKFEMLEVGNHPMTGLVRPNLAVADRTALDAGRVQPQRLVKRDRLPAFTDAEFATGFANIGHSAHYNLNRRHGLGFGRRPSQRRRFGR